MTCDCVSYLESVALAARAEARRLYPPANDAQRDRLHLFAEVVAAVTTTLHLLRHHRGQCNCAPPAPRLRVVRDGEAPAAGGSGKE